MKTSAASKTADQGYRPKRWTRREYVRLTRSGMFGDRKVELIGGVIEVISPQKNAHVISVEKTVDILRKLFGPNYWVRSQSTLDLRKASMPDPDVAVIGVPRDHAGPGYPTSAELIVEISDATLRRDRTRKASLYAAAGIKDYWIVNLVDRHLELLRAPLPDEKSRFGFSYSQKSIIALGQVIAPLALPHVQVNIDDLLP